MARIYATLIRKGENTDLMQLVNSEVESGEAPGSRGGSARRGRRMSALREFCLKYLLRKEEDEMAVVYATLIIKGKKTIDQVPARLRKQVEEILEACEVEI